MIHLTAEQVLQIIVAQPIDMLVHRRELPEAHKITRLFQTLPVDIAARSPFADWRDVLTVIEAEMRAGFLRLSIVLPKDWHP